MIISNCCLCSNRVIEMCLFVGGGKEKKEKKRGKVRQGERNKMICYMRIELTAAVMVDDPFFDWISRFVTYCVGLGRRISCPKQGEI